MILHDMTWEEVRAVDWGQTLVVIPVGSTEQHGPHLPTDTDTFLVSHFARNIERAMPQRVMLTPTTWLGHSPHHLSFGATLSAHHQLLADLVLAVCRSVIGMGARRLWILNGHGGNRLPLGIVLQQLKLEYPSILAVSSEYWTVAKDAIAAFRESELGGMGHACELETSLYLYLAPERVRRARIADGGLQPEGDLFPTDMFVGGALSRVYDFTELTESGTFGRATLASEKKGERFYKAICKELVDVATKLLETV